MVATTPARAQLYTYTPQTGGPGVNVRQEGSRWQAFDPQTATTTSGRVTPGGGISGHASDGTIFWGTVRPSGS